MVRGRLILAIALTAAICLLAVSAHAGPYPGWNVRMIDVNQNVDNTTNADLIFSTTPPPAPWTVASDSAFGYALVDLGTGGSYGLNQAYPTGVNATDTFTIKAKADVTIPAGTWSVAFGSDDGGRITIPGITFDTRFNINGPVSPPDEARYEAPRGHTWTGGTFTLASDLTTTIDSIMFENGGGDSFEIAAFSGTSAAVGAGWQLLGDGTFGWSVTNDLQPTGPAAFRVNSNTVTSLYLSETDLAIGTPVTVNHAAGNWTGTARFPENYTTWIHLQGVLTGGGNLSAQFTAEQGYIFQETGSQFITTNSKYDPHGSDVPPAGQASWTVSYNPWDSPTGRPYTPIQAQFIANETDPNFVRGQGTERIWGLHVVGGSAVPNNESYFSTPATMIPGIWSVFGERRDTMTNGLGLAAQITRVNSNLDNLGQADTALTRVPGNADFSVSQLRVISGADIDTAGNYGSPAGVLPGDQHEAQGEPRDYAIRLRGYIQAPSDGYIRSFAISGDNAFYFKVGDVEFSRSEYVVGSPPMVVPANFPTAGYYPIELVYRNRDGAAGLELSSRDGAWTAADWSTGTFAILGTDPSYEVRLPDGVTGTGPTLAPSVGNPLYAGAINPVADGFRVQQAYPASHGGANPASVDNSITFFSDKVIQNGDPTNYNIGVVATRSFLSMQDTTAGQTMTPNFTPQGIPLDNISTSYAVQAGVANDNYVTRINGLVYIPAAGTYALTNSSDDGYQIRVGNYVAGRRPGGGGVPAGTANYLYGTFPAAGLYPFEYYQYEGTGGSGIELAYGGSTNLLLPSRNPASNGFTPNWAGVAYAAEPVAMMRRDNTGVGLEVQAYTKVPALNMAVAPERWRLSEVTHNTWQGLMGSYYTTTTTPYTLVGQRLDLNPNAVYGGLSTAPNSFNFPDNYAYGPWGNMEDNLNVIWEGNINIPATGLYSFRMDTDDNSWIYIDVNGNGVFDANEGSPGNSAWTIRWENLSLTEGLHKVMFQAREGGGGEWSQLRWLVGGGAMPDTSAPIVPANVFSWEGDLLITLAEGTGAIGDLSNYQFLMDFDFESTHHLRLVTEVAGLTAVFDETFFFTPEPTTLVLLAGGLLAIATRRRNRR